MITGFNTDVDYQGRVFHVQTEDRGQANPLIESLIYCGGEILASRQNSYAELAASEAYSEDEVLHLMELQHQALIREIFNGKYDTQGPKPFGYNIITNRSLDEVVLEYLADEHAATEAICLQLIDDQELIEGTRPMMRMKVVEEGSERPLNGAEVTIKLISTDGQPYELFSGPTDDDGFIEALFEIPEQPGANLALLCRAELGDLRAELRQLVKKPKQDSTT
jgi:hypothetical protein